MRKRKLLTALLAVAALMAIAIPASATDGAWTPGTDPRFDVYDSLTPNNARQDANDWNPNSMYRFHSGHYDIDNLCTLGLGWNWTGHSGNDWMITAGHCLSYFAGGNETNIDGVPWTKNTHACNEFSSPACSTWPSNRNNWGYYADSGTDRTSMFLDSSIGYHANQTDYDSGLGTLWRGDIAIFRVDKEAAARKAYLTDVDTKWDIGAKFVPDPYTEYANLCVFSPMLGAETCDWTVTGVDNMSLDIADSGATWRGLTEITRSEDGSCAVIPGDSGALVYLKTSSTVRPVGILSGGQQNCSTAAWDPPYSESQYFTSMNQIEAMWPGGVIN